VPEIPAIVMVVLLVAGVLAGGSAAVAGTLRGFTAALPRYEEQMQLLFDQSMNLARAYGLVSDGQDFASLLAPSAMMGLVGQTVSSLVGVLAQVLIVTVTLTFILLEARELSTKLRLAFGDGADGGVMGALGQASSQVQRYLLIKTMISLATGAGVGLWCWGWGLDFPLMWALLAYLLNYIPSIGSIVAALPPIALAVVQLGLPGAGAIGAGYLLVNVSLGNFLEPRLLGASLGLSPLVVFLSLLFWGWVWGPVGMLFCVPMTVIAKIILEQDEDTRWIAVLLGPARAAQLRPSSERASSA
jgi:predicted PurR-regulated permease PerM